VGSGHQQGKTGHQQQQGDSSNAAAGVMIDLLECTLWQRQLGSLSEETVAALVCQVGAVGYGLHRVNMSNSSTWAVRVGQAAVYGGAGTAAMQEKAERLLQRQFNISVSHWFRLHQFHQAPYLPCRYLRASGTLLYSLWSSSSIGGSQLDV